jgi:hypothetical protein
VPELSEGSGVAASLRSPGRLWAHNDSGEPVLVALDPKGAAVGRVRVSGAKVEERPSITIYRVPEPADASGSAGEPQGEGIAFGDERTIYLVGEGGGKSQPGTFARLACTF